MFFKFINLKFVRNENLLPADKKFCNFVKLFLPPMFHSYTDFIYTTPIFPLNENPEH